MTVNMKMAVFFRGDLTALVWKDKREVYILTSVHQPPAEGKSLKPANFKNYNMRMGYINKSNQIANNYSISQHTFKWTKKLFFHLFDVTTLNSWILLSTCLAKYSQQDFLFLLLINLIDEAGKLGCRHLPMVERRCPTATNWITLN
jgi:hypothetical protein